MDDKEYSDMMELLDVSEFRAKMRGRSDGGPGERSHVRHAHQKDGSCDHGNPGNIDLMRRCKFCYAHVPEHCERSP